MSAQLFPIVSEFETGEQAACYDSWFRAEVQTSLANPGLGVSHDEVMSAWVQSSTKPNASRENAP